MSDLERRVAEAEGRLAEMGLAAHVEGAGTDGELAVIRLDHSLMSVLLGELRTSAVRVCKAAGFRYVAVELYSSA